MKIKYILAALLTTATSIALGSKVNFAQEQSQSPQKVTFSCQQTKDWRSRENVLTTVAWVPRREAHVPIFRWKPELSKQLGLDNLEQCETISNKIQEYYDRGELKYITYGRVGGYPVICAVNGINGTCNQSNILFTLKNSDNPQAVMIALIDIIASRSGNADFLELTSEEQAQLYVSLNELLQIALTIDVDQYN
ncbi:MAG: COP23 domain-containing protein [Prochloraceae cyanobacterium]|nr:COP23 domain-containing protein [Prochloraceae cyanobacterium]